MPGLSKIGRKNPRLRHNHIRIHNSFLTNPNRGEERSSSKRRARTNEEHHGRDAAQQMKPYTGLSGSGKSSLAFDTIFAEVSADMWNHSLHMPANSCTRCKRPDVDMRLSACAGHFHRPEITLQQSAFDRSYYQPRYTDYLRIPMPASASRHCLRLRPAHSPHFQRKRFSRLS